MAPLPIMEAPFTHREQPLAAELFEFSSEVLVKVRRKYPGLDDELFGEAFVKAVLQIARKPEKFDQQRGTWADFLAGATLRNLRDLFRADEARGRREEKKGKRLVAEQESAARNPLEDLLDVETVREYAGRAEMIRAEIAQTEEERRLLQLWEQGVDDPVEWGRALGIEDQPANEQAEHVGRFRKRLMKRIERLRDRLSGEETGP